MAQDFEASLRGARTQLNLLQAGRDIGPDGAAPLAALEQALARAELLTRQMLAFSRQQPQHMAVLNLAVTVGAWLDEWQALLPPDVLLTRQLDSPGLSVLADAPRLRQVMAELWRNACQAVARTGGHVQVKVVPDAKTQVKVEFEPLHSITEPSVLQALISRYEVEQNLIDFPYTSGQDEESASKPSHQQPAAAPATAAKAKF